MRRSRMGDGIIARACPPEDGGGTDGDAQVLEILFDPRSGCFGAAFFRGRGTTTQDARLVHCFDAPRTTAMPRPPDCGFCDQVAGSESTIV